MANILPVSFDENCLVSFYPVLFISARLGSFEQKFQSTETQPVTCQQRNSTPLHQKTIP